MNTDQKANIECIITAVAETIFSAWAHLHLLEGLHRGGTCSPTVVQKFEHFFDEIWRATFDSLFSAVGAILDQKKGTNSLPALITKAKTYGDANLKNTAKLVQDRLNTDRGALKKMREWRHEVVAHRPSSFSNIFYEEHELTLDDVKAALRQLEQMLDDLSFEALQLHNELETGSEILVKQGVDLFACLAEHESANSEQA